ncbi:MAG: hypothetical protein ACI8P0_006711 [Planctomycetaceae bacterium]
MRKLTGLFIVATVTGTVWWQLPNVTGMSLAAQTGRTATSSSNAYQATARRLMQLAQAEARRGNSASAKRLAFSASRFPVKWATTELSPPQLLSQLQRGRTIPPRHINPASVAGRRPATPAQPKPFHELVTRTTGTTSNSLQPTIAQMGFNELKPRPTAAGSTGEARQLRIRVDQHMARARAAGQEEEPVHLHVAHAPTLAAAKENLKSNRLESAYEKALPAGQGDTVRSLFDETPEQVPSTICRRQQESPRPIETLVQSGDSVQPKAPASPFSNSTDFSATLGQATTSAAASGRVLERLDQPQSVPTDQTSNISDDELAKQLLVECRQLIRDGRFDDARAAAIRAKNLNVTFDLLSDTPQLVLRDINFISGAMTQTGSSQAKLDTLPDTNPFQAPADPTTAALALQSEKHAKAQKLLGSASQLVEEAHDLKAPYLLFDERSEIATADVERLQMQFIPPSPPASRSPSNPFAESAELTSSNIKANSLRKRVDPRAAGQKGDRDGAVRQATVAGLLPNTVKFQSGEETPVAFPNRTRNAVTIPFQGSFEEMHPFEAAPEESLAKAYEVLQLTPENDDSQSVELVTNWSSSITKITPVESSNPSFMEPAANAHETQRSLLPLPSARMVGVEHKNNTPQLQDQERVVVTNRFVEPFNAAYEELQLTLVNNDLKSVELVTHSGLPVTKVTAIELFNPSLIQPATNAKEARKSSLPLPSARSVDVWHRNDAPLELPTVTSNSAPLLP